MGLRTVAGLNSERSMLGNRRRLFIGVFFTLLMVVVVTLTVLAEINQTAQTVSGFSVVKPIGAGTSVTLDNVRQVQVKSSTDFAVLQSSPVGQLATHPLAPGDLIRADDVTNAERTSQVAVSLSTAPGVGTGDTIDIYTVVGKKMLLLAKHVPVVGSGIIQVPAADVPYWLAIGASGQSLLAAKVSDQVSPNTPLIDNDTALSQLSGIPAAQISGGAASASTTSTPSPSPGQ